MKKNKFIPFGSNKPEEIVPSADEIKEIKDSEKKNSLFNKILKEDHESDSAYYADSSAEKTVIAFGTAFEGDLKAGGDVEIRGAFKGELTSDGTVTVYNDIVSNITAANVILAGAAVSGDIKAFNKIEAGEGSEVNGKITAQDILFAGKIKGDITASGNCILHSAASVLGNIKAATLSIAKGALISGNIDMKISK